MLTAVSLGQNMQCCPSIRSTFPAGSRYSNKPWTSTLSGLKRLRREHSRQHSQHVSKSNAVAPLTGAPEQKSTPSFQRINERNAGSCAAPWLSAMSSTRTDEEDFRASRACSLFQRRAEPGMDRNSHKAQLGDRTGMESARGCCHGCIPARGFCVQGVSRVRQSDQGVDVEKVCPANSARAACTSSLVTLIPAGDWVIRNPVFASLISLGRSRFPCSGVRTMDPPSTLQENFVPGCNRSRIRACLGSTTWPLLDNVASCLTVLRLQH